MKFDDEIVFHDVDNAGRDGNYFRGDVLTARASELSFVSAKCPLLAPSGLFERVTARPLLGLERTFTAMEPSGYGAEYL